MDPQITQLQKAAAEREDVIGLAGGLPAEELLPREALAKAFAAVASRPGALQYGWPEGTEQIRGWVVARLAARGATVDAARVIITAGAQQALTIAATVLAGKSIAVGEATYPGALDAFRRAGVSPIARDGDVSYVMSGVANPIGRALPVDPARIALADEAYTELRFDGKTPRPVVADAPERTWHVGTISKTIAPGLRIGWLIPPAAHHADALEIKAATDLQTASITQAALGHMLQSLDYDALVARARAEYARRADALVGALRAHVPQLRFLEPEGGFSIWGETDREGDEVAFLEAALAAGVMVDPGSLFRVEPRGPLAMRLSFSNTPLEQFVEGARRLARALE
jgi:2-aminoadipate transaminase